MKKNQKTRKTRFWTNSKVQKYFAALCKESAKMSIDWGKFRELDKKGIFKNYTNTHLAVVLFQYKRDNII